MRNIEVVRDIEKVIEFFDGVLRNENISRENKELINECLKQKLHHYLSPVFLVKDDKEK